MYNFGRHWTKPVVKQYTPSTSVVLPETINALSAIRITILLQSSRNICGLIEKRMLETQSLLRIGTYPAILVSTLLLLTYIMYSFSGVKNVPILDV